MDKFNTFVFFLNMTYFDDFKACVLFVVNLECVYYIF